MGKKTGIAWCDHTFNGWWGCVRVSPACDNCYAEAWDARFADKDNAHWGPDAPRKFFSDKHWGEPVKWNRTAERDGIPIAGPGVPRAHRRLVFCASMSDVFETRDDLVPHRMRLWGLIASTPYLTWLLLTKRPQNIRRMLPAELVGSPNVWLGTTIESPQYRWRLDALCENDTAAVRFVSMEPLIEDTPIEDYLSASDSRFGAGLAPIDWVITGCESGPGARHTPSDWYRRTRDECIKAGKAFFFKQAPRGGDGISSQDGSWLKLKDNIVEQPYLDGQQWVQFPS